jgi:hypothetical protein
LSYPNTKAQLTSIGAGLTYGYANTGGNHVYTFTVGTDTVTV